MPIISHHAVAQDHGAATTLPLAHAKGPRQDRPNGLTDPTWAELLAEFDVAFQPIVNIHTGYCYGYEALLRGHQAAGFANPHDFFDACHGHGVLVEVENLLREKVMAKFSGLDGFRRSKLFLNIDNRMVEGGALFGDHTRALLDRYGFPETGLTFELSERHQLGRPGETQGLLQWFKRHDVRLAIDDFGVGFSGLQTLYFAEPDIIKIDRFFIADIASDAKKKLFLAQIVNIAHLLGAAVVAEGVETEQEYHTCRDIGCDLLQGYLVQRPTTKIADLTAQYPHIEGLARRERRAGASSDQKIILDNLLTIPPISVDAELMEVFDALGRNPDVNFVPVIDNGGHPLGIVLERNLKELIYSRFGKDLIRNKTLGRRLKQFLTKCPIADVDAKAENILQLFSADTTTHGILIVRDMAYAGFLSAASLLRVINEKNLVVARDQNPLTKLPGNVRIHAWVSEALADNDPGHVLAYFDFDHFKPFNDKYGFRLGDRAILLFAELLPKMLPHDDCFIGHIGGDDFFAGFRGMELERCQELVAGVVERFASDVASFYDEDARVRGHVVAVDRDGHERTFPLLGVSAAVLEMPPGRTRHSTDDIGLMIAELKKHAKASDTHICSARLPPSP